MNLVRVIAFAVFFVAAPVASPAQSLDLPLPSAQCTDEYCEDAADQCGAISGGEVVTIEAILAKYGVIITERTDDEIIAYYPDDLDEMPVGSIRPRNEDAGPTDEKFEAAQQETIMSRVVTPDAQSEIDVEAVDDITTTGPAARRIPAAIGAADE